MNALLAKIIGRKTVALRTREVRLSVENNSFSFVAGQYIRLTIPELLYPDSRGNYRDFSILSSPNDPHEIRIAMRESDSGFKRTLMKLPLGTLVKISGPFGDVVLPKSENRPLVCVAGGIGITPFLSKISFSTEQHLEQNITLLYSNASEDRAAYTGELDVLSRENSHLVVKKIFGKVSEAILREAATLTPKPLWQIAGPPAMTATVHKMLIDIGVSEKDITREDFRGYDGGSAYVSANGSPFDTRTLSNIQTLLNILDQGAIVSATDIDGTIVYANDNFVKISGYSREELLGQNHRILKSGHQSSEMFMQLWRTITQGETWQGEIKNRAKDGSYYWVDATISPIFNDVGEIVNYIAFRFVITDRKAAEENLRRNLKDVENSQKAVMNILEDFSEAKAKEEAILESIGEGLIAVDRNDRIIYINQSAQMMLGYGEGEIVGKEMMNTIRLENEDGVGISRAKRPLAAALDSGSSTTIGVDSGFYVVRRDKTRFPVALSARPILLDGKNIGAVVAFRDITTERAADRAKSEFVSLASHQLRTPLAIIRWFTEGILGGSIGIVNEKQKDYLRHVHDSNQRMIELVNSLLNVSRIEMGVFRIQPSMMDICAFIGTILAELQPEIEKKQLHVATVFSQKNIKVPVDAPLFHMVLSNLFVNAIQYTPKGGTINITCSKMNTGDVLGKHLFQEDSIVISVKDSGCGVPNQQQKQLCTKFFRADNAKEVYTEGTGLGLYIVKSILDQSGGHLWFVSEENKGSTFYVAIPLTGMWEKKGTKSLIAG